MNQKRSPLELKDEANSRLQQDDRRNQIVLVLDNIRSVYNIGAIFRVADAAGVSKIFLCGYTAVPPRPDIHKTALGTENHVDFCHYDSAINLIKKLKSTHQIIALEQTDSSIDYRKLKLKLPLALVLGNEVTGVDQQVLDLCDLSIEIPMVGYANSLNVSVAVGIVLFDII